jgi:indolepyruvate ferredoxin oxidoreductase beta subunit
MVTDVREILPMPVLTGAAEYPHDVVEVLKKEVGNLIVINASAEAEKLGNMKAQNIVLLGALTKQLALDKVDWKDLVAKSVPAKLVDLNLAAYDVGFNM